MKTNFGDFSEISSEAYILMKGPPRITDTQRVQYGREGTDVRLTCKAFAIPPPTTIVWSNYGFSVPIIDGGSGHYRYHFLHFSSI